jgi:SOS-response transcriptional repressor LexA
MVVKEILQILRIDNNDGHRKLKKNRRRPIDEKELRRIVGENIKRLREKAGLAQPALAEKLGLELPHGQTSISRWENGKHLPGEDVLRKISDLFNVKYNSLYVKFGTVAVQSSIQSSDLPLLRQKELALLKYPLTVKGINAAASTSIMVYDIDDELAFAVRIEDDSMTALGQELSWKSNDIVVVSPHTEPESGDLALVKFDAEIQVRQIYYYHNRTVLKPLNPRYEEITISKGDEGDFAIIGKVVQHHKKL